MGRRVLVADGLASGVGVSEDGAGVIVAWQALIAVHKAAIRIIKNTPLIFFTILLYPLY
jgi:hypothetical protein